MLFSFIYSVDFKFTRCKSSSDTVRKFMLHVEAHSPQRLVGYNNFRYDIACLVFHASISQNSNFIKLTGSGSSISYSFYIDINGVFNVEILAYLDKTRRSNFTNLSLSNVVK